MAFVRYLEFKNFNFVSFSLFYSLPLGNAVISALLQCPQLSGGGRACRGSQWVAGGSEQVCNTKRKQSADGCGKARTATEIMWVGCKDPEHGAAALVHCTLRMQVYMPV